MQSAVQFLLKNVFEDYVNGIENPANGNSGSGVTFHDLALKTDRINEDMDDDGACPFTFDNGTLGFVSLIPSWTGGIEIKLDKVTINMSFNALKAMKVGFSLMKAEEEVKPKSKPKPPRRKPEHSRRYQKELATDAYDPTPSKVMYPGQVGGGYQFCATHSTSEKRGKGAPAEKLCQECNHILQTNYTEFTYCFECSLKLGKCMICARPAIANKPSSLSSRTEPSSSQHNSRSHQAQSGMNGSATGLNGNQLDAKATRDGRRRPLRDHAMDYDDGEGSSVLFRPNPFSSQDAGNLCATARSSIIYAATPSLQQVANPAFCGLSSNKDPVTEHMRIPMERLPSNVAKLTSRQIHMRDQFPA